MQVQSDLYLHQGLMGRFKRESAFEHAQNMQINILLRVCKVSYEPWLNIDTYYCI